MRCARALLILATLDVVGKASDAYVVDGQMTLSAKLRICTIAEVLLGTEEPALSATSAVGVAGTEHHAQEHRKYDSASRGLQEDVWTNGRNSLRPYEPRSGGASKRASCTLVDRM